MGRDRYAQVRMGAMRICYQEDKESKEVTQHQMKGERDGGMEADTKTFIVSIGQRVLLFSREVVVHI